MYVPLQNKIKTIGSLFHLFWDTFCLIFNFLCFDILSDFERPSTDFGSLFTAGTEISYLQYTRITYFV